MRMASSSDLSSSVSSASLFSSTGVSGIGKRTGIALAGLTRVGLTLVGLTRVGFTTVCGALGEELREAGEEELREACVGVRVGVFGRRISVPLRLVFRSEMCDAIDLRVGGVSGVRGVRGDPLNADSMDSLNAGPFMSAEMSCIESRPISSSCSGEP